MKENKPVPSEWSGKRVTVVGAGVSGRELALLAARLGASVFVSENKSLSGETRELFERNGVEWEAEGHTKRAFDADVILLSSGIPPRADVVRMAAEQGVPVLGELDFVIPQIHAKLVGVTGSNGKSTVTALIGHMMKNLGWNAGVGGNLGTAASTFTEGKLDAVVLELSSFQLARANRLSSEISIITNLAPDHIDWHGSYEAYVEAKAKLLTLRSPTGWGIVQDRDVEALSAQKLERVITLGWDRTPLHKMAGHIFMGEDRAELDLEGRTTPLFLYSETTLLGSHNLENIAMSLTALHLLGVREPASALLKGFAPLPHRCEYAGTVDDVLYVDDSKGTNVAASVTAMTSIQGRKVVILGGRGKGEDYAELARAAVREADAAVLLGEEKEPIAKALSSAGMTNVQLASDMEDAVKKARSLARPGMTVLLSPACTSWDMYDNYGQRGDHFCSIVRSLQASS